MTVYILYQIVNFILLLSVIALLRILYERYDAMENRNLFLAALGLGFDLVGCFAITHAQEMGAAMVLYRFSIFGRALFAVGYSFYISNVFKAKLGKLVLGMAMFPLALAFAHSFLSYGKDPYLSNLHLEEHGKLMLLVGEREVYYWVHLAMMLIMGLWTAFLVIRAFAKNRRNHDKSETANGLFYLTAIILQGIGFLVYETHYSTMVNFIPMIRALCTGIYVFLSMKYNIFNVDSLARQSLVSDIGAGFLVLTARYDVLFANEIAKDIFPEIDKNDKFFLGMLTRKHEHQLEKNGTIYRVIADRVIKSNKIDGYKILVIDITDLVQLEKQLISKEKSRQNLLTNISHELRTPLNAIIGASEMINSEEVSKETYRDYAEVIKASTMNLDDVLNDILAASSTYPKVQTSDLAPYSILTLVENMIQMCNDRVTRKNVRIMVSIAEDVPINAIGDDGRIRQVLLNILSNSIRNTDDGYVSLVVSGEYLRDGRFEYIFTVRDTGKYTITQDENVDKNLFEGDELGFEYTTGYGISLIVAKKIANALDGDINSYSIKDVGNVYSVVLPSQILDNQTLSDFSFDKKLDVMLFGETNEHYIDLRKTCAELNVKADMVSGFSKLRKLNGEEDHYQVLMFDYDKYGKRIAQSEKAIGYVKVAVLKNNRVPTEYDNNFIFVSAPLSALTLHHVLMEYEEMLKNNSVGQEIFYAPAARVLIVDDNTLNLELARNMIERFKVSADIASNGYECIDLINSGQKYDLIFMDYMMEGMDGIETTRLIRNMNGPMKDVPILAYTANSVDGATEKYLEAGMNGSIYKPANILSFSKALRQYLPVNLIVYEKRKAIVLKNEEDRFPDIEGVDKESAVKYCANNLELYEDMLGSFALDIPEKEKKIMEYFTNENYKDFVIAVHGVKGPARTVGLLQLSDRMAAMEKAGSAKDVKYIKKNLSELLSYYRKYSAILAPYAQKRLEKKSAILSESGIKRVLLEMSDALEDFEMEKAQELFAQIEKETYDDMRAKMIENLRLSIESADYYASKEQVEALIETY